MVDKQFASVNNVPPEPWTGQDTRDRGMRCLIAPHFLALSRFVAAPGESSDRLAAAAAENEVSAEVMQVGKGLLSLWDILVEWHRCCPLHRGINARCYPPQGYNAPPPVAQHQQRTAAGAFPSTARGGACPAFIAQIKSQLSLSSPSHPSCNYGNLGRGFLAIP